MTATPDAAPAKTVDQINAPEELKALVDPASTRQASILEQFLADVGATDGPPAPADEEQAQPPATEQQKGELLLGKFRSQEELARAYQELEKKLGQPAAEPAEPQAPAIPAPEDYTPEKAAEVYGEVLAERIGAAEINPFEMWRTLDAGGDVSPYVNALVEKGGIPRPLVEAYLQGLKPAAAAAPTADVASLNDNPEAVAALRQSVGGDAAFDQLSRWAAVNLSDAEKAEYQAAVDTGNVLAAQWALRAIQAKAATSARSEPMYLGGGAQASEPADVYTSRSDWQAERYARDANGDEKYLRDEGYRSRVDAKHARSKAAGKW